MKDIFAENKRFYPPRVIGSVTQWETWQQLCLPTSMPPCHAVELRLDALSSQMQVDDILAYRCEKPTLLTFRHADEGGFRTIEEEHRMVQMQSLLSMCDAIDWEIRHLATADTLLRKAKNAGVLLVASHHDFEKTPQLEELKQLTNYAREKGADIVKFAFRLNSARDMLVGVRLLEQTDGHVAVMGMGPLGPTSRLLYAQYGSALHYGYLGETPSAPGQWSAQLCTEALDNLSPTV